MAGAGACLYCALALKLPWIVCLLAAILAWALLGVISGAILSWIMIITELSTSIILYNPSTKTMTLEIYSQVIRGNDGVASAISASLTFSTIIALALFFRISGKKEITM